MATTKPVILILGSGPNVGQHVAEAFAAKGYRVALASRGQVEDNTSSDRIHVQGDLSDPDSVSAIFSKVTEKLGIPSVVVHNAPASSKNDPRDPLSVAPADFARDLKINTTSAFVAAQQAVLGFEKLPDSASKTFIYTGNILNTTTIPQLLTLGVGKSATAHIIQSAAAAYSDRGFKFYYADERNADGTPMYSGLSGEAHSILYRQLAEHTSQGPWQQTFVKNVGYKSFEGH